jgi:hypothetical protein
MSEDRNLVLPDALAHHFDQLVEIGDELFERHGRSGDVEVEGFARTALVPIDDREALLERRVVVPEERRIGQAGPAVQEDKRRIVEVFATYHYPLIEPAQAEIVDLRDAVWKDLVFGSTEGWRLSQVLHDTLLWSGCRDSFPRSATVTAATTAHNTVAKTKFQARVITPVAKGWRIRVLAERLACISITTGRLPV